MVTLRYALLAFALMAAAKPATTTRSVNPEIDITATRDTLQVEYQLPHAAARLTLAPISNAKVRSNWTITSPGMVLDDRTLRRTDGAAFNRASVSIVPDVVRIDRAYPQALRVGDGWMVYGPYLQADREGGYARFTLPPGWIAVPNRSLAGHFYVGPAAYLRQGIVSPPIVPDALRATVKTALRDANDTYAKRFSLAAPKPPLVIIMADTTLEGTGTWRGDSTPGVLSLRFAEPTVRQPPTTDKIRHFVAHEVFHDWWKGVVLPLDGERGAWIEEGMAEYAALLSDGEATTVLSDLTRHLNGCRDALSSDGLLTAPPTVGQSVYDCGVVFQWLRDLQWRAATSQRDDAFAGWRNLLIRFRRTGHAVEWRAAIAGPPSITGNDPADLLLSPASDRWARVVAALNGLGARVVAIRNGSDLREALLKHMLLSVCHGRMGFSTRTESVKLDTGDRCGPLNGDPVVDAVADHNLMDDPAGAFAEVGRLCANDKPVALQASGRTVATLVCTKPLEPPAEHWSVEAWKPFA